MKTLLPLLAATALSACGESGPVNPPTEPAQPIEVADPAAPADDGTVSMMSGRGPTSFVGRWAANVAWCAAPQGAERPIEITPTRFEGYENSCSIAAIDEVVDGYIATLACVAEGQMASERVRFQVTGDVMRLTYLDRGTEAVTLNKCTTLEETAVSAVAVP
ncbi:hypothetical protein [Brevundimonas aurifodinae]|uniref:Uncharacterized protein n=2 Tax=Brevundimonas TaxID=41275 RepID=A0ABV1NP98_9CAUL|nr:MAG: hypothetical protein B7Z42_03875 [Brevundimonas sp. 12-68-7]OYX35898.1 MAG: hypothetical protein B7Z01_00865 [Brevundimonas subvibrioides]